MAQSSLQNVLSFARRLAEGSEASQASDRELLEHFRLHNDHYSFAALIERHGGMVWAYQTNPVHSSTISPPFRVANASQVSCPHSRFA